MSLRSTFFLTLPDACSFRRPFLVFGWCVRVYDFFSLYYVPHRNLISRVWLSLYLPCNSMYVLSCVFMVYEYVFQGYSFQILTRVAVIALAIISGSTSIEVLGVCYLQPMWFRCISASRMLRSVIAHFDCNAAEKSTTTQSNSMDRPIIHIVSPAYGRLPSEGSARSISSISFF